MNSGREHFDTAVVGAGVFGVWTAWHLQQAGQRVLLIDPYGPGNARASSGGETRVIRMAYGPDDVYTRLSLRSLTLWKQMFAALGQPELFRNTGVLWLAHAQSEVAAHSIAALNRHGVAHECIGHEALMQRYPQIAVPHGGWALFEPESGGLLARRAVQAVAAHAQRCGVEILIDQIRPVRGTGRLSELCTESGDAVRADRFVFACGPWIGKVLPDVMGEKIFPTRQEVFYFGAPAGDRHFRSDAMPIWLDFDRDYYGFPDLDGRGFKVAHDQHGEAIDPDRAERTPTPRRIEAARAFLARRFPALAAAPVLSTEVCQYENTSNGDFIIDLHPGFENAWIVAGGSGHGFKHGPAVGEYAAQRMLGAGMIEERFNLNSKQSVQRRQVH